MRFLVMFAPLIAFPVTFFCLFLSPWVLIPLLLIGLGYALWSVYGLCKAMYYGTTSSKPITTSQYKAQDKFDQLYHDYKHRQMQDGKY